MNIKKGDSVAILNRTFSGKFYFEGMATVIKVATNQEGQHTVIFDNEAISVKRFIDPAAQADPEAYVKALNEAFNHENP